MGMKRVFCIQQLLSYIFNFVFLSIGYFYLVFYFSNVHLQFNQVGGGSDAVSEQLPQ
jgi:hypothetical protein